MEQYNYSTKKKKFQQITEKERYKIEGFFEEGLSSGKIAELLAKSKRTIERERKLGLVEQEFMNPSNKKYEDLYIVKLVYRADTAQMRHGEQAANKGRNLKIGNDQKLADYIEDEIKNHNKSPDAIIGEIKAEKKEFKTTICTKTVYNYIDKGIFREVTNADLPIKKNGKKRDYSKIRTVALNNKDGVSITERPKEANDRSEYGHWEIDLVVGKQGTKPVILTLVERKTRQSVYVLVKNKTQKEVLEALKRAQKKLGGDFKQVFKTITADNGSEFLDHEGIKAASGCDEVYYAHPYSSWERGSNENGNRMLRRFVPKGADIGTFDESEIQRIEDWVNNYPRRIFNYKTANQMAAAA
jgi:IS30 family transposase